VTAAQVQALAVLGQVLAALGQSTTSPQTTLNNSLPDCVCKRQWLNTDGLCNISNPNTDHGGIMMSGCPTIDIVSMCEDGATQSYCETTQAHCKQQVGESMTGQGWAYCNPVTQKAQLPKCTCKSRWQNADGVCASSPIWLQGCPTVEQMKMCEENYEEGDQPWCETNEELCYEQENGWLQDGSEDLMVGRGWAYCDPFYQETELPACECEDQWTATAEDCRSGSGGTFYGCPTIRQIQQCEPRYTDSDTQSWCVTTRQRCREQTYSTVNPSEDMRNDSWAYCNPVSQKPEWPVCECKESWFHEELKCADNPLEMHGCPSISQLSQCEYVGRDNQPWCDTTFQDCEQQNYESDGKGWSYCDASTDMGVMADCECENSWYNKEGNCNITGSKGQLMRGCPSLEAIQFCDPSATQSWCDTKDKWCAEQTSENEGEGWVYCEHATQWGTSGESKSDVAGAVAASVVVTFLICALGVLALLYYLRKKAYSHRAGYSQVGAQKLLSDNTQTYGNSDM